MERQARGTVRRVAGLTGTTLLGDHFSVNRRVAPDVMELHYEETDGKAILESGADGEWIESDAVVDAADWV